MWLPYPKRLKERKIAAGNEINCHCQTECKSQIIYLQNGRFVPKTWMLVLMLVDLM